MHNAGNIPSFSIARCLLYLVPPNVSRSSTVNLQSLIEGLLARSSADRVELQIEVAMLGTRHEQLGQWLEKQGITTYRLPTRNASDPSMFLNIRRFLMRRDPELVHVWQGGQHLGIWVSALLGTERVLVDQAIPECVRPDRSKPIASLLLPLVRLKLTAQTEAVVDRFDPTELMAASDEPAAQLGNPCASHIIGPGIAAKPEDFDRVREAAVPLRESLGLPPDAELIGMVSAFRRGGGGKDAIWAADLLKCVRDHTHLLMFGDGPLRWRLKRFRWQTETEDRVHFVEESRFYEFLPHLFCFWQATHAARSVQSLLSAMAAAVPVVVSDLPSHRQVVKDMETGMLVTPGNRGSLARKTDLLLRDTKLRRRLGAGGRDAALKNFAIEQQVDGYADLYKEVLSR